MIFLVALFAALTVGSLAHVVTVSLPLSHRIATERLRRSSGGEASTTAWGRIGRRAMASPSLSTRLPRARLEADLPWAQLGGKWIKWTVEELIGLSLATAVMGLLAGVLAFDAGLISLLIAALGFYIPAILVRSAANGMRRAFLRQLPEMVQVVATEVNTGTSIEMAIERLSSSPTIAGRIFADLIARTTSKRRFSDHEHIEGELLVQARRWQVEELTLLLARLDRIQRKGSAGSLLATLARNIATRYLGEREKKAEGLENALLMPLMLFFFLPLMLVVLGPIMLQVLQVF